MWRVANGPDNVDTTQYCKRTEIWNANRQERPYAALKCIYYIHIENWFISSIGTINILNFYLINS
jgi:hypothetical protein